jgi:hypothetical protein
MRKMKKKDLEFELNGDINEVEIDKLINIMEKYVVNMPSDEAINLTIEKLRPHVPTKKSKVTSKPKIFRILVRAFEEISFMSNNYWLISFGLTLFGLLTILLNNGYIMKANNPYMAVIMLAPLPFIFGIIEVFKGREEGVLELELSCKLSITEIILSRLVIISIYSILLNTVMSGVLVFFDSRIMFWKITLLWLTPFTMVSSFSLLIVSRMRGSFVVTIFTAVWMILIMSVLSQEKVMKKIMGVNISVYIFLSILGIILLTIQIIRYGHRHSSFFERSALNEVKN